MASGGVGWAGFFAGAEDGMRVFAMVLMGAAGVVAGAQDAGQQLQQQAIQQQQILQQQQQTQQQIDLINQQQINQAASANLGAYQMTLRTPRVQQRPGTEAGTVEVTMEDGSRGASIFYTTDGWTPTSVSARYVGPFTMRQSGTVQAIALAPGGKRSRVAAVVVQAGASGGVAQGDGVATVRGLVPGTVLPLVFTAEVTSRGRRVGDTLPVALADDVVVEGRRVAPRGTPVDVIVTQVDNAHRQGLPGVLSFAARSVEIDGQRVALLGVETMEGADRTRGAGVASLVPLGGLAVHGGDAVILPGRRFEARVAAPETR